MALNSAQKFAHRLYPLLHMKQSGRCYYCGRRMLAPPECDGVGRAPLRRSLEHLIPPKRGGLKRDVFNVVLACDQCNVAKGDLTEFEFAWFIVRFGTYPTAAFKLSYAIVCGHNKRTREAA